MVELIPVVRSTAAQKVAQQLLALVRSGALVAGAQLPGERELIEKLGVGRSTVREALQILATLNVVQVMPGQGTFVKTPSPEELLQGDVLGLLIDNAMALELLEAREMIEPRNAQLACERATEDDFREMSDLLHQHEQALSNGEGTSCYAADFHVLLAKASHNRVSFMFMRSIIEILKARGRVFDRIPDYRLWELQEHREILRLIACRDADGAADYVRQHIFRSAVTYDTGKALQPSDGFDFTADRASRS